MRLSYLYILIKIKLFKNGVHTSVIHTEERLILNKEILNLNYEKGKSESNKSKI